MPTLATHPQRSQIVEYILAGENSRAIAQKVTPAVSHKSICLLAREVKTEIQTARVIEQARKLVVENGVDVLSVIPAMDTKAVTGLSASAAPHLARIQENAERLRRIADRLELEDPKTAITAIKTDLTATELSGRFDRSLEATNAPVINVQQVMILPGRGADAPAEPQVVEAEYEELEGVGEDE